jgi:hypothetical protein
MTTADATVVTGASARIATLEDLREHLQWAIELEHATLPAYLCALYSLDRDRNRDACEVLTSVFVEEMLHLALAANVLNAVGGRPVLDSPRVLLPYPRCLPHGDPSVRLSLLPFGPEAVEGFLRIEQPAPPGAPQQGDRYGTIGQFYDAIRAGLVGLCDDLGEAAVFPGDPGRQVGASTLAYGGSGRIIAVDGLASALAALDEVVVQGEGADHRAVWDGDRDMFHPERDEVGHHYRFHELRAGRRYRRGDTPRSGPTGEPLVVDWDAVRPMRRDPRRADHLPGSAVRAEQEAFDRDYSALLGLLDAALDGEPGLLAAGVGAMYGLRARAERLLAMPIGDGRETAGPTFEYGPPEERARPGSRRAATRVPPRGDPGADRGVPRM